MPAIDPSACGERGEVVYPTDSLRAHERFEDYGSSEQAFTVVRTAVEHLSMLNVVRWLEQNGRVSVLESVAFVMDGQLAIFGMAAWLKHHIEKELTRLHALAMECGGSGVLVMGVELTALQYAIGEDPARAYRHSHCHRPLL